LRCSSPGCPDAAAPRPERLQGEVVLVEHLLRKLLRRDQRVRGADPLAQQLPPVLAGVRRDVDRDPAVTAQAVSGGRHRVIGRDHGGCLVFVELDREVHGLVVAEDEVLVADPEGRVIAPLSDVNPHGFGELGDDALESLHVSHSRLPHRNADVTHPGPSRRSSRLT